MRERGVLNTGHPLIVNKRLRTLGSRVGQASNYDHGNEYEILQLQIQRGLRFVTPVYHTPVK